MRKEFSKIDKPLFIIMILLCGIGLIMVFSSSFVSAGLRYHKDSLYFFIRQLIFLVASFIGGFIVLKIPTKIYKAFSWLLIIGISTLLILLLIYGSITNHAQSWFYIPHTGFALQPSEFAKSFLIIFMATYYDRLYKKKVSNISLYLIPLSIALLLVILIIMQPDLGSALILFAIAFCIFISIPTVKPNIRRSLTLVAAIGVILGVVLLYTGSDFIKSEQISSRFNFLNPCKRYKDKTGYQVCNGFIAINNGGLTGVGIGNSTQKRMYLPESHTDFIFAILVEELGVITGVLVLLMYAYMLYRILNIAKNTYNLRNSILAYGTFWLFSLHILINLSGMLALLPLTGVPLPLLSYGGSSTINFVIMLFIVLRVSIENNKKSYEIEVKKVIN